jgi:hypothetical protein
MKNIFRSTTLCLAAILSIAASFAPLAYAATTPQNSSETGQALEIAPPVVTLVANPGQTINSQISLRDVSTTKLLVTNQINDFTASGEDGTPKLLIGEGESSPYSMKDWFRPIGQLTLNPKEIQNLPFTIDVPASAAPGSYFSVVRFTASAPELDGTGVALSASLGALVFLRVNGDAHEKLTIASFTASVQKTGKTQKLFEGTPINFVVRVKNEGNVHEQPAGQVIIKDMFGKTVAGINVNLPPRNILPGTIRRFESTLDKSVIGKKMLFGFYRAEVTIKDAKGQISKDQLSFWVIPWKLMLFGVIGVVVGFIVLRNMIRNYNRRIVERATGTKKTRRKK